MIVVDTIQTFSPHAHTLHRPRPLRCQKTTAASRPPEARHQERPKRQFFGGAKPWENHGKTMGNLGKCWETSCFKGKNME